MRYQFELTGLTPLLLHADNLLWSDMLKEWRDDPSNKASSVRGDDRSPAWTWIGSIPPSEKSTDITIPSDYLSACLKQAGGRVPTGTGKKTYKEATQTLLWIEQDDFPVIVNGKPISFAKIKDKLMNELSFPKHLVTVRDAGFDLDARRAKIGMSKHVRVRPKFVDWKISGTLEVLDDAALPEKSLHNIFAIAGRCGLGDWRPGGKSPGRFGQFEAVVKRAK